MRESSLNWLTPPPRWRNCKEMKSLLGLAILAIAGCTGASAFPPVTGNLPSSIYEFKMTNIDGKSVALSQFKGKVLMIVNVASRCGNTPQYAKLEALYEKYHDQGFEILGFPANDFMHQEPGTNAEIKTFCTMNYGVKFPMFSKITVKGDDTAPLYQWLIANSDRPKDEIEWNFAKFIIGKDGKELMRVAPGTQPDSPEVIKAIESALKSDQ